MASLKRLETQRDEGDAEPQERDLAALAAELEPALVRYFSRRIDATDEIPDLVNEVFVRLLRRRSIPDTGARGYVFEAANSVLVDWLRRRRSRCATAHERYDPERHALSGADTDLLLANREELDLAANALMELPERTRTIFILRRLESMPHKDIAARLSVSISTVEKHMQRAMNHLLERLNET